MKIKPSSSYKVLVEVENHDGGQRSMSEKLVNCLGGNGSGFEFAVKVTTVFLLFCVLIAFQVALTLSTKSEHREDVAKLIKHLESQSQYISQSQSQNPVSLCHSCGESEADELVIRDMTSKDIGSNNENDNDNSTDILLTLQLGESSSNQNQNQSNNNSTGLTVRVSEDADVRRTSYMNNAIKSAKGSQTEYLDNVFFSVKSSQKFHKERLEPILKTWFNLARDQTWIFTDADDPELIERTNGHIINTNCPSTHYRQALCCKMATEFDTFLKTTKSWFCHFDDDNYVNVPALLEMLGKYNSKDYWYLGKPSLKSPIRIRDPDNHTDEVSFWFATGGAGFCLSRALALRMSPLASGGKFTKICDRIQLPDDVTVGYIAGHLLGQNLTVIPQFHSHFETMKFIDMKNPSSEITFSHARYPEYENILEVDGFSNEEDPTRFLSLHCQLFPNFSFCPKHGNENSNEVRRKRKRRSRT